MADMWNKFLETVPLMPLLTHFGLLTAYGDIDLGPLW